MTLRPASAPPVAVKTRDAADPNRPGGRAALSPTPGSPAAAGPVGETDAPQTQAAP